MAAESESVGLTYEHSSDEDTEDASEPDMSVDTEHISKNGTLQEKLALLQSQLYAIEAGSDPEYLARIREVDKMREHRLFVAETFRDYELEVTNGEYDREKEAALEQYEAKKLELRDYLLHDLQDKRRAYDNYRNTVELGTPVDSIESKTMVTRKLRRRHCEPVPTVDKRRKVATLSSLVYVLDDSEVEDDTKLICKGKITIPKKNSPPVPVGGSEVTVVYEARVEEGKLYYEGKWFHKGQQIFVLSKEHGQESGIITSISQSEIWVKRLPDNSKLRIYLSQLTRGKYVLKRRSA